MNIQRILISIPNNSPYYRNLYPSIKSGFEEAGCQVIGESGLPKPNDLLHLISTESPDIVFEMNRSKSEVPGFPTNLPHICWLVDFWGRKPAEIQGSDILYTFVGDWADNLNKLSAAKYIDYLPPGIDIQKFFPCPKSPQYDFAFLGHIPRPWSEKDLNRIIIPKDNPHLTFRALNKFINKFIFLDNTSKNKPDVISYLNKKLDIDLNTSMNPTMRYDITSRAVRQIRRDSVLKLCLSASSSIIIYGTPNWLEYPNYKKFYNGFLDSFTDIRTAMQQCKILINDSFYPHFRTFEAMASGVTVATVLPPNDYSNEWNKIGFIAGEDYLPIDFLKNNIDKVAKCLRDEKQLQWIADNALRKINRHTWAHRARKILNDVTKYT